MLQRKVVPAKVSALSEDEVEVRMSTATLARDGHILLPQGARLDNYKKNPVFLWNHDTDKPPVGRAQEIAVDGEELVCRVKFPPAGISVRADEIRGLVKAGFINGVSVGFDPLDGDPIDPKKPRSGVRFTDWELLECSFCNVPVDAEALVTARSESSADWKCGCSRDLPIDESDAWDGPAAEASVFKWAGGDDFDPSKARKAFLAYNAAKPKERGSYKLPIAHVVNGRLKVPKGAIRAAASRLSQADIPDAVKKSARAVLDHYEEKAGMGENDKGDRALRLKHTRALGRAPHVPAFRRGIMDLGQLAWIFQMLGYAHECSEYETALEGDESPVPAMLGECLVKCGESLIAMTHEEVTEALAAKELEGDTEEAEAIEHSLSDTERAYIAAGATPRARAWRRGIAIARAGKTLSNANQKGLQRALKHHERADKHNEELIESHQELGENLETARAAHEKATKAHGELGDALQAAQDEPKKAADHLTRATKLHKAVAGHQKDVAEAHQDADEAHQDAGDSGAALARCMGAAQRCVRSVVEGSATGAEDGDSKLVQTSAGIKESSGSEGGRAALDYNTRQAELKRFAAG